MTINLTTGVHTGDAAGDSFSSIEIYQGSSRADTLTGDSGGNNLQGAAGNDLIEGRGGADTLDGGAGTLDFLSYEHATSAISLNLSTGVHTGDPNDDVLTGFEGFTGTAFADTLVGSTASENFMGGAGADQFTGGGGSDYLWYATSSAGVNVNLATSTASGGDAAGDTFTSFRSVLGSVYADTLTGDSFANLLGGGGGNDSIIAGDGDDTVQLYATGPYAGIPTSYVAYVDAGNGNDIVFEGTEDAGSTILGGSGNDEIHMWLGTAYGGSGNDIFISPGIATMYGEDGDDTFTFQGMSNFAYGGEGNDTFNASDGSVSFVSDTGSSAGDKIVISAAATWSDIFTSYDSGTDTLYITTDADVADGFIDSGVGIINASIDLIERAYAADGSFIGL
ncbi:calcium-binding protein [Phenylobacterium sp. LjRoot225]